VFSSPSKASNNRCDIQVPLEPNTILNNVKRVTKYAETLGGGTDFPYDYLEELIQKKIKIDNFIILSDMMVAPGKNEMQARGHTVSEILKKYRTQVNPDLLFVAIDLYGNGKSLVDVNCDNPLEIQITGFSDNILRFIAKNGDKKQLEYVQKIDQVKHLDKPRRKKGKKSDKATDNNNVEVKAEDGGKDEEMQ